MTDASFAHIMLGDTLDHNLRADVAQRAALLAKIAGEDSLEAIKQMDPQSEDKTLPQLRAELKEKAGRTIGKLQGDLFRGTDDDSMDERLDVLADLYGIHQDKPFLGDIADEDEKRAAREELRKALLAQMEEESLEEAIEGFAAGGGIIGGQYIGGKKGEIYTPDQLKKIASMPGGEQIVAAYTSALRDDNAEALGGKGRARVVNMMLDVSSGLTEESGNRGAIPTFCSGYEGEAYCSSGLHRILWRATGSETFDSGMWRSARALEEQGAAYDALIDPKDVKPGDIITRRGSGRSGRHVMMVSRVDDDGTIWYADFNGGKQGQEKRIDPNTIIAAVDIEKLVYNKTGKTLDQVTEENIYYQHGPDADKNRQIAPEIDENALVANVPNAKGEERSNHIA